MLVTETEKEPQCLIKRPTQNTTNNISLEPPTQTQTQTQDTTNDTFEEQNLTRIDKIISKPPVL
jgi:hypothetical protein